MAAEPFDASVLLHSIAFAHWTLEGAGETGRVSELGQPWAPGSDLDHVYYSPPYLMPAERWHIAGEADAHWCWVVPITRAEADLARTRGGDALEEALESASAPIGALSRPSVC